MNDIAAMREKFNMKRDMKCSCGSNIFSVAPILFTHPDGRSLSSNLGETPSCSLYAVTCLCGCRYLMASQPKDHDNTLIPIRSDVAKDILKLMAPDFSAETLGEEVHVEK
jgi:hypothetical protein